MTDPARTPIKIEQRRCSRPEFKAAGAEVTYVAFVTVLLKTGWPRSREQLIAVADTKIKLYLAIANWQLKKGIKNDSRKKIQD